MCIYIYQLFRLVNLNKGRVGVTSVGNSLRLTLAPDMQNNALNFKCLRNQRWQRFFNLLVNLCFILWIFWVLLWIMQFFMNCWIRHLLCKIVPPRNIRRPFHYRACSFNLRWETSQWTNGDRYAWTWTRTRGWCFCWRGLCIVNIVGFTFIQNLEYLVEKKLNFTVCSGKCLENTLV